MFQYPDPAQYPYLSTASLVPYPSTTSTFLSTRVPGSGTQGALRRIGYCTQEYVPTTRCFPRPLSAFDPRSRFSSRSQRCNARLATLLVCGGLLQKHNIESVTLTGTYLGHGQEPLSGTAALVRLGRIMEGTLLCDEGPNP